MKTTEQLLQELDELELKQFLKDNVAEFIRKDSDALLNDIIESRSVTKSEIIAKSNLNKVYGYQIFSGTRTPTRDKLLPICLAAGLTLPETQELLCQMKLPMLYIRKHRDCIIIYAINKCLSVMDCNILLYEAGENTLG